MTVSEFFSRALSYVYRKTLRRVLPVCRYVKYNEVKVEPVRSLDKCFSYFPKQMADIPNYEDAIVDALEQYVQPGDTVTVIGGGYGVSVVKALQKIGKDGKLFCYEGSKEYCKYVNETIGYNEHFVDKQHVTVANYFVGSAQHVYGHYGRSLPIEELPICDVLELDCEGSEKLILPRLLHKPRTIIVETHGIYGASTKEVRNILEKMGYDVVVERVAERNHFEVCVKNDIMVLVAVKMKS